MKAIEQIKNKSRVDADPQTSCLFNSIIRKKNAIAYIVYSR